MKLEILPRGHVRDAVGVLLGEIRQRLKLLRVEPSRGDLDALHPRSVPHRVRALGQFPGRIAEQLNCLAVVPLTVVVALAVDASSKPRFSEQPLVDLALLAQGNFRFEDVYFTSQMLGNFSGKPFGPERVRDLHLAFASITSCPDLQPSGQRGLLTLQQPAQLTRAF